MRPRKYTVVQVTDSHLLADDSDRLHGRRPDDSLAKVLAAARTLEPDLVVATGDLTEHGDSSAYDRLRVLLSGMDCPVACIPGNHDDPEAMRERLVGEDVLMVDRFTLGRWRILLLDSTVPGRPEGRLGSSRLAALDWHLHETRGNHRLVFVHHQPVSTGSPWIDGMGLTDGQRLLDRLTDDGGAAAVAFGHIHHAFNATLDGLELLGTPATSFQARPRRDHFELDTDNGPGFRWFRLFPDGLLETGVNRVTVNDGS